MANAHKDRKNVIYEICNEPNGVSWSQVVTYANDIIPRIRAIDPDAVIIVGTPNWSQLGEDVVNNKLAFTNIMYTFHFYAATHDTSMLTNFVGRLPIFVTEWAATEASGAGGTNYTRADQYISIMQTNKISWCAWSWSEAPETSGMLNVGSCDAANWTSLKQSGTYVVGKVSNPADNFPACFIPTATYTPTSVGPEPTATIGPNDLRLDNMTDGNYTSNVCTYWYTYDDSNDCTDKNCTLNPHGNSQIVPWSKDHWEDLGRPIQPFYMQAPGRNGAGDYAARITGVVTTTFLYGFAGLGLPLKEPEGPVNISTATGISFWCKSNQSRDFRLKINSPQAFGGKLDEDMYGYVFTAGTTWQKVTVDFSSVLFSQEGWGDKTVTKTMALSAVDTIQWQTEGQTGAPYNFDLWIDDVVLLNAPAPLRTIAAVGCTPPTPTHTWNPSLPTYTHTPTPAFELRVNCGGAQYTDGAGKVWLADKAFATGSWGYEGGGGVADNTGVAVAGTTDDVLYQSERWGSPTYRFTVPNGSYQVVLKFAEMYFTASNMRVFNVAIEGTTLVTNLDIVAAAGAKTALDRTFIVNVTDGRLDITSSASVDGALFNAIAVLGYTAPVNTQTGTNTYTQTRTYTHTATNTYTRTYTATGTATGTATRTFTNTPTRTATATNTFTNTATQVFTATATNTSLFTATYTNTAVNTATPTTPPVNTATPTTPPVNTATPTTPPVNTATPTTPPVNTATPTTPPVNTATPTTPPVNTATNTDTPVFTQTETATSVNTTAATDTATIVPSFTPTAVFTASYTATFTQTLVFTLTPSHTVTITHTFTVTNTHTFTFTHTNTFTNTPENTVTYTYTPVYTNTPTPTYTPAGAKDLKVTDEFTYPNPYNPKSGMPFKIKAHFSRGYSGARVKIYTQSLRCIREFTFPAYSWPGDRIMDIPASKLLDLASGSYYFVIIAEDKDGKKVRGGITSFFILK